MDEFTQARANNMQLQSQLNLSKSYERPHAKNGMSLTWTIHIPIKEGSLLQKDINNDCKGSFAQLDKNVRQLIKSDKRFEEAQIQGYLDYNFDQ